MHTWKGFCPSPEPDGSLAPIGLQWVTSRDPKPTGCLCPQSFPTLCSQTPSLTPRGTLCTSNCHQGRPHQFNAGEVGKSPPVSAQQPRNPFPQQGMNH